MGILTKNQRTGKSNRTQVVNGRLTEDEFKDFKELCEKAGYSISEAVRLLVINEVNSTKGIKATTPTTFSVSSPLADNETTTFSPAAQAAAPRVSRPTPRRVTGGRFITEEWKVDGLLPCPICESWHSSTNISRHFKSVHGEEMTTEEAYTTFKEKADQMVIDKRSGK